MWSLVFLSCLRVNLSPLADIQSWSHQPTVGNPLMRLQPAASKLPNNIFRWFQSMQDEQRLSSCASCVAPGISLSFSSFSFVCLVDSLHFLLQSLHPSNLSGSYYSHYCMLDLSSIQLLHLL